jgi:hypothetical protein
MRQQLLTGCLFNLLLSFSCFDTTTAQSVQLGQMVKQTMKESWADIEPLGQDEQGLYYLAIPWGEVISGPVAGDADY